MDKYRGIYCIQNLKNGKCYVGSGINVRARKSHHFSELKYQRHKNIFLQRAYNKEGKENFKFIFIERVDVSIELYRRENFWVNILKANDQEFGYNIRPITAESNIGWHHTEATKLKISKNSGAKKGKESPNWGRSLSEESIRKRIIAVTGQKRTDEMKRNMSDAAVGKRKSTSKKYVGVYKRKENGRFRATFRHYGIRFNIGTFLTEEEAVVAYNKKAREILNIDYDINIIEGR